MTTTFRAIVAEEINGKTQGRLKELSLADLPDEDVLVHVAYSTLNYKDGLAVSGKGKICRKLPMVCGIDLAGVVVSARDPRFKSGDEILINGYGLSESYWGGYSQYQRVKGDWLVRRPPSFSLQETMAIGTAGYTAMLCVQAILDHKVTPDDGEVLVTGASGGVGTVAILLLAKLGYRVTAASGRVAENEEFLKSLGAAAVIARGELARPAKPLEGERWAAVVDSVGAETLATALAQTKSEGIVAACGLAGGMGLPTSVAPFILRGVTLRGINSVTAAMARREQAWASLAALIDKQKLASLSKVEPMSRVPELAEAILRGEVTGRIVIDVAK